MGLTWLDAAAMTLIVVEAAFLAWLLRHRAMGSRAQRLLEDRLRFETLLSDLSATESPYFCPHGRPIVSRLSLKEIKRELRRTW